jgi:hypothetical protein
MNARLRRDIADAEASLGATLVYFSVLAGFGSALSDPTTNPPDLGIELGDGIFGSVIFLIIGFVFVAVLGAPIALAVEYAVQRAPLSWIRPVAHFLAGSVTGFVVFHFLGFGAIVGEAEPMLLGLGAGTSAMFGVLTARAVHRSHDRRSASRGQQQTTVL